jgi:hypothetical protein
MLKAGLDDAFSTPALAAAVLEVEVREIHLVRKDAAKHLREPAASRP